MPHKELADGETALKKGSLSKPESSHLQAPGRVMPGLGHPVGR